jgi:MFS family permease
MAPILAQVFLPNISKLSAYFFYFSFEIFAAICQICGSYIFGKIGDKKGRVKAMYYSMLGTSIITFFIAIIPTYNQIGLYAAILFALSRALQSFFLGGEYNGGAIYCSEHEKNIKNHCIVSGIYGSATVLGVLVASIVSTTIMHFGKEYFRIAYILSITFTILTIFLRRSMIETPQFIELKYNSYNNHQKPKFRLIIFLTIALASLLSGVLYGLPTRIFNVILPLITNINQVDIMLINSSVLIIYMLLLLWTGYKAREEKILVTMQRASLAIIILTIPALLFLESKTIFAVIITKLVFAFLSASLIGPFHAWTYSISTTHNRYLQISVAYSIGKLSALIILPLSILFFEYFNSLLLSGAILSVIALIFLILLNHSPHKSN